MLNKELQKIVDKLGGLVVVEDGQPRFVLVSYERFKSLNLAPEEETVEVPIFREQSSNNNGFKQISNVIKNKIEEAVMLDNGIAEPTAIKDNTVIESLNKEILALKEEIENRERELGLVSE